LHTSEAERDAHAPRVARLPALCSPTMGETPASIDGWLWEKVPHRRGEYQGRFLGDATSATAEAVVSAIPRGGSLQFFDLNYFGPPRGDESDPGAIFSVYRDAEDVLYVTCGNHGWAAKWHAVDDVVIARYFFRCRENNLGPAPGSSYVLWYARAGYRPREGDVDPKSDVLLSWEERREA
jgi:hypothetical protein